MSYNRPIISVIIPVYNRRNVINRAVESVIKQTFTNIEIILVDDGSTDDTFDIFKVYEAQDKRIRIYKKNNGGVSSARNFGISKAEGLYIAFLDSDDEWDLHKLEKQLFFMRQSDYLITQTDETWIRNGKQVTLPKKYTKSPNFTDSLSHCIIGASTVMVQAEYLRSLGGFSEALPVCEDYDMWLRILCHGSIPVLKEELTLKYGGDPDQLSLRYPAMDRFRVESLEKIYLSRINIADDKRDLILQELVKKLEYLRDGAQRRGSDASVYQQKLNIYKQAAGN